ncbi:hypothetical protein B0D71_10390 [Pseudomonas laurylsulfativorans]|uniref:Uncharacterized protein n=1 Tax=Pseudomonas laurylsulfativorans TaxID=1943631 RepID=A0A2S3VPU4_9PSED|nr:hypothetical protein B0D71_10390 [Pseudomonas laurylsulfativorans]
MIVNDNACLLAKRGALEFFAGNRASTGSLLHGITLALALPCDCEKPISDGLLAWRRATQQ